MNFKKKSYRIAIILITGSLMLTSVSPSAAEQPVKSQTPSTAVSESIDKKALSSIVSDYDSTDPQHLTNLVESVTPENSIRFQNTDIAKVEDNWVVLGNEANSQTTLGFRIPGEYKKTEEVNGVIIKQTNHSSLDSVVRATEDGAQLVAVINEPKGLDHTKFEMNLPEGAKTKILSDGSVSILSPTEIEIPLEGEETKFDSAIDDFIEQEGITEETLSNLSEEQLNELLAIPGVKTKNVTIEQEIATIEAPWAVDAEGKPLDTEYVIEGSTLIQKVQTTNKTIFPIVMDPKVSWKMRIWHGVNCLGSIAALGTGAAAFVKAGVKFVKIVSAAKKGTTLYNAYQAYRALIRLTNTPFYDIGIVAVDYFKAYAGALKHGTARAAAAAKAALASKSNTSAKWKNAVIVFQGARGVVGEVLGLNDCTIAVTGKK